MKYSIGVDLHKVALNTCVLDESGNVVEEKKIATKCRKQIRDYFAGYGKSAEVAVESVGFYQWFWKEVQPVVGALHLAEPVGVRAAAGRRTKNDRNDAWLLADLLRSGRLPTCYVPTPMMREFRNLLRLRHTLANSLSSERRRLRWIGLKANLPGPKSLTSDAAQKWIRAQKDTFEHSSLIAAHVFQDHIIGLERDLDKIENGILDFCEARPELKHRVELLRSIPGVGPITALTILAETGDILRFDNSEQLANYAGLSPRTMQSGDHIYHGHITKQGPPVLRRILQQAAWVAIREDKNVRRIWSRIGKSSGKKKATTAIARKILTYARAVIKQNSPFVWPEDKKKAGERQKEERFWNYQI